MEKQSTTPERTEPRIFNFFRAVRDEDSFTILYELAYWDTPASVEKLAYTFGASTKSILQILARLRRLRVATKTGTRWALYPWAKTMLQDLEDRLATVPFKAAETTESSDSDISVIAQAADVGTYNGFWIASASQVTVLDNRAGVNAKTATADEAARFAPDVPDRGHNETRSHDYK